MSYLLLIDDEPQEFVRLVHAALPALSCRVEIARTGAEGIARLRDDRPYVVLLNLHLSDQSGVAVYHRIREFDCQIPVIFMTGSTDASAAIEAMREGAYDCLFKPLDVTLLGRVVGEALDIARRPVVPSAFDSSSAESPSSSNLVGSCPAMRKVYKTIGLVAAQDFPVLITGESGTGKELVARAIHQHSNRGARTFMGLNAAAIPENLLESELFGYEKGAFTGANQRKIGKFEHCHGGTLFLDEIGDMPAASQAKILRLLQEQAFERVGGNETVRADVRLIAATHRDLSAWVPAGRFRADLFYRLSVFPIHLPPLRERREDLPELVTHFLRRFSRELGRAVFDIAPEALERLQRYSWPGNIRELQSVLKQALLRASGSVLLPSFLPGPLGETPKRAGSFKESPGLESFIRGRLRPDSCDLYAETHRQLDRFLLPRVLDYTRGSQHKAASLLGIARQTLRHKLREQGYAASIPGKTMIICEDSWQTANEA
jgi:two-component system nitrogen regulation response regulator GlnG